MTFRRGWTKSGESTAPVEFEHPRSELEQVDEDFDPSADLLNWRNLVCHCTLEGPERGLAYTSEVVSLTDTHVVLQLSSRALMSPQAKQRLAEVLSEQKGHSFTVEIAATETKGMPKSILRLTAQERRAKHKEQVAQFRRNPFVQKCAEFFDGSIDDDSVTENLPVIKQEVVEKS